MLDCEIQILDEAAGGPAVIINAGTPQSRRQPCATLDEARLYATGIQDGWTAARRAIGSAHIRYAPPPEVTSESDEAGRRAICARCNLEIERHPPEWLDRGGNANCAADGNPHAEA